MDGLIAKTYHHLSYLRRERYLRSVKPARPIFCRVRQGVLGWIDQFKEILLGESCLISYTVAEHYSLVVFFVWFSVTNHLLLIIWK